MAWSAQLHPRAPVGTSAGGQFAAGSGSASSSSAPPKTTTAKGSSTTKPAVAPNGLGYSNAQWAALQKLEAIAAKGGKLDAHQQHELHVAHQKKLAAAKAAAKKPAAKATTAKKTTAKAKPKTAAKPKAKAAAKPKAAPKKATAKSTNPSPVTARL